MWVIERFTRRLLILAFRLEFNRPVSDGELCTRCVMKEGLIVITRSPILKEKYNTRN